MSIIWLLNYHGWWLGWVFFSSLKIVFWDSFLFLYHWRVALNTINFTSPNWQRSYSFFILNLYIWIWYSCFRLSKSLRIFIDSYLLAKILCLPRVNSWGSALGNSGISFFLETNFDCPFFFLFSIKSIEASFIFLSLFFSCFNYLAASATIIRWVFILFNIFLAYLLKILSLVLSYRIRNDIFVPTKFDFSCFLNISERLKLFYLIQNPFFRFLFS